MAARNVKASSVKAWLTNDEYGTWEKTAQDYLDKVPELKAQKNLHHMTDEQIDDEIAYVIGLAALEAALKNAEKKQKRKS